MSKGIVTRLFVGSMISIVAGAVLSFVAVWAAFANGAFVMNGPDVTGIHSMAWTFVGYVIVAVLVMLAGFIGGVVAWIGALLNTARLDDKSWFILLLVLGLISFGVVGMIAYVIAGPDGTTETRGRTTHAIA